MNIRIQFNGAYSGVVHARDFRTPACMALGNGSAVLGLSLNLLAKKGSNENCGILVSNVNGGEVSVIHSWFKVAYYSRDLSEYKEQTLRLPHS